ncbi:P-loop containing nucleoside triphosphate hydrolase protein [Fistulina hepatica ATCC 64428]|uniref:p-loop containing nucleoside triphosphate hydrolase protein n=1 Tax=Fistulina hepatica ATCC 64428 TaxID=1128425 RepID=A0A0D7A549_9AGAR|nr:P-loop containing nucleoside triphosphate hydrolase protein [Fistulina hepatica ATCC 64428]
MKCPGSKRISGAFGLRPYQEHCLRACTTALSSGYTRLGVSLPTGSGKTTVFISLLSRVKPPESNAHATKSLIIVNSIELARQSAEQVARLFPNWVVEIEQGQKHKASGHADVTIATYQTLSQPERTAKFNPNHMKAIIIDEAHHAAAPSYRRLLAHFSEEIVHPDPSFQRPHIPHKIPIVGFSATFSRLDGLRLGSVFERIVYHRDFLDMIQDKWLCDVRFTCVYANLNLNSVIIHSRTGDFQARSLAHVVNTDTINELVVKTWLDKAADRKSTLVFCVNIAHVKALTNEFRKFGVDARYVYAKTPAPERKALVSAFKQEKFPVLINCAILTEGTDIPNIDCVVVARPTRSRNLFAQMIGRGMRLSPDTGKTDCRIIDFVDNAARVAGVITTPTLFGLDPNEVKIEDETPDSLTELGSRSRQSAGDVPAPKTVIYKDYDNPFSFIEGTSGAPHLTRLTQNAWVGCGSDVYVLECLGMGFIRIERFNFDGLEIPKEYWQASYTPPQTDFITARTLRTSPYRRKRLLFKALSLADAIRACDTFAQSVVRAPRSLGLRRSAAWRKQPASESQRALVAKRWKLRNLDPGDDTNERVQRLKSLTKGEATNIIARLRHGAQTRFEKRVKEAQRIMKEARKVTEQQARTHVVVGPLKA